MSGTPYALHLGDCIEVMRSLGDNSVDAVVTDPPYGIRFMGKAWDGLDIEERHLKRKESESHSPGAGPNGGHKSIAAEAGKYDLAPQAMRAFQEFSREWAAEAFRVLKPGGHLLSFSSGRTYHRMTSGIEDAGFEVRDQIMWLYGSGFPKSMDVSKAIDKAAGAEREVIGSKSAGASSLQRVSRVEQGYRENLTSCDAATIAITAPATDAARQWSGWGTALKPAHEPICVARKPLIGTVAANVLEHGTGAINIDSCRVRSDETSSAEEVEAQAAARAYVQGRWPANVIHDGSPEVIEAFAQFGEKTSGSRKAGTYTIAAGSGRFGEFGEGAMPAVEGSTGTAARFFYCAKASRADRNDGLPDPGAQFKKGTTLRDVEVAAAPAS